MKKFLSLVLALIMTMSLVTISAGATEYRDLTDKEEIQYEEAVAVLNRIGVITGYEDGSFRPETELTRGAAAKIIVSLMIGPDAASALPNNASPYPDVPAGHTFAGVIGYCKTAGYISGYGDGTFKPANPLTGYAFAKMLLGAIGYKANVEGFVDTGWTMNVARIGNVAGLFDRLDFDGAAAVTRDEACQLALNTLKATMVDYGGTNTVVSSNGQVLTVQGSKAVYVTSNNRDINANINRRVISATNNELTLEFGEEHFKDLRLEHDRYDPAFDVYGHPSNEWSYKKVTIGTFPLEADFTFTKQMAHREDTVASKEKALGLRGYDTYSTDHRTTSGYSTVNGVVLGADPFADATQVTINGFNARVHNTAYTNSAAPAGTVNGNLYSYDAFAKGIGKDNAPSLAEICDLTDNGVTVEVYVCPVDADYITHVVVTRTQLMKVKTIGSDYVALENISPDSKDPRKEGNLSKITGYNAFAIDVDTVDVKDSNYDAYNTLKEMKAGDRVAIVPYTTDQGKTWEVGEAYAPETAAGALTKIGLYSNTAKKDGNAVSLTVGGTEYPVAEWNKDIIDADGYQIKATKKDVTVYLDKLGNVLWADEIGNSDAWMVVGDYYQAANSTGKVVWFVHGWTIGGDEVNVDLGTIRGEAEKYAPGELVRYTIAKSGTGEYKLSKPSFEKQPWLYKNGDPAPAEDPLTDVKDDITYRTGEGIYEISQYAQTTAGTFKQFSISSGNSDLALENYSAEGVKNKALVPAKYNYTVPLASGQKLEDKVTTPLAADPHEFKYNYTTYDGVKFIFVSFDNYGEVETIDIRSGVQNVSYKDLTSYNTNWTNVGTNGSQDAGKFIANAAEAYVNDSGKVKAVVIKSDSPEANLSNVAVITDYVGSDSYQVGASKYTEFTRKYRIGPKFDEELTGTFDRRYDVGDIVTIRGKDADEIITAKPFHGDTYLNTNPDVFVATGISTVKSHTGSTNKSAFVVGDKYALTTIDGSNLDPSRGDVNATKVPYGVDILSSDNTLGDDWEFDTTKNQREGLVTVNSDTVFIDQHVGHRDNEIDSLEELIDNYDLTTAKLRVLVGGKPNNSMFRHAYVVFVEYAVPKADNAETPEVTLTAEANNVAVEAEKNVTVPTGYDAAYKFKVPANATVDLNALMDDAVKKECATLTYSWTRGSANGARTTISTSGNTAGQTITLTLTVNNYDSSKDDQRSVDYKVFVTLEIEGSNVSTTGDFVKFADTADKKSASVDPGQTGVSVSGGDATFTAAISVPEYARVATTTSGITAKATVYGPNGVIERDIAASFAYTSGNPKAIATITTTVGGLVNANGLRAEITEIAWDYVAIEAYDKATDKPITLSVAKVGTAAADNYSGTFATTATTVTATLPVTVTGAAGTFTVSAASAATVTVACTGVKAAGDQAVKLTIDRAQLAEKFKLTAATAHYLDPTNGVAVAGGADKLLIVPSDPDALAAGNGVNAVIDVSVQLTAAASQNYGYLVKIKNLTTGVENPVLVTGTSKVKVGTIDLRTAGHQIANADVEVTAVPKQEMASATCKAATADDPGVITITYTRDIAASEPTVTCTFKYATQQGVASVSGKTITIKFTGTIDAADTVKITGVKDAAYAENVDLASIKNTITLTATDGTTTLTPTNS